MNNSVFTSQFQMVMMQLIMELLEKYTKESGGTSQTAEAGLAGLPQTSINGAPDSSGSSPKVKFEDLIQQASDKYEVDDRLIKAIIQAESGFNPNAVSRAGAAGLMQLMPGTARGLGVTDPFDPQQNIFGGTRLLRRLLNSYDGNIPLVLAGYNAGMGAVKKYGGVPPYQQTQTYINRVMSILKNKYDWSA
jgi:soluble lytic murein transglycosylase-like protein